jgi:putative transposase
MLKNRKLARVVSDARFGEIRRQLTYKTPWNGGHLEIADRCSPPPRRARVVRQ